METTEKNKMLKVFVRAMVDNHKLELESIWDKYSSSKNQPQTFLSKIAEIKAKIEVSNEILKFIEKLYNDE